MSEFGQFDLKGLIEYGVNEGLKKLNFSEIAGDVVPLVGGALSEFSIPHTLEIGAVGTIIGKAIIAGISRQQAIARSHQEVKANVNSSTT